MAGDFDGTEVICPACHEKLKLPERPEEVPPLVSPAQPTTPTPEPPPIQMEVPDEEAVQDFRSLAASRQGRRKLLVALLVPLFVAITAVLLLPGKKSATPPPEPAAQADAAPVTQTGQPSTEVVAAPAVEETTPEVLETQVEAQASEPLATIQSSQPAASEPPPEISEQVPAQAASPNPEEGLVAAIPDTPANRRAAAPPAVPTEAAAPAPPAETAESVATAEQPPPTIPATPTETVAPAQTEPAASAVPAEPVPPTQNLLVHTVARGETLTKISRNYQVEVAAIRQANGMKTDRLLVGQLLSIPGGIAPAAQTASVPASTPQETAAERHHTVVRGDTLGKIARKYGVDAAEIMRVNGMKNDIVRLGAKLVIPAAAPR